MTAINVSHKLGEYMLKGWVLTDNTCANDGCPVPLMRSPKGQIPTLIFCANCDNEPKVRTESVEKEAGPSRILQSSPSDSHSSTTHASRPSTPPTDLSSIPGSPFLAPAVDPEQALRRRQQSDRASAEIANRLLKGWAMLADECPNETCYGVPLVRAPASNGQKDPRKECVVCGGFYVDEKDAHILQQLQPELSTSEQPGATAEPEANQPTLSNSSRKRVRSQDDLPSDLSRLRPDVKVPTTDRFAPRSSERVSALDASVASLELALHTLSKRLTDISSLPSAIDPISLGQTAEALGKVAQALTHVEQLRGHAQNNINIS